VVSPSQLTLGLRGFVVFSDPPASVYQCFTFRHSYPARDVGGVVLPYLLRILSQEIVYPCPAKVAAYSNRLRGSYEAKAMSKIIMITIFIQRFRGISNFALRVFDIFLTYKGVISFGLIGSHPLVNRF
jgi:hypothetical protein